MPEASDRPYQIELPVFEGPLDLLLHLVKKHELDIFDIPIAFVTEKYLEYLDLMRALSLELAGEYLLMAATLMYIKSRELLPSPDPAQALEEEAEEGDPREELIRRLLEYQKYKAAAEHLGGRPVVGRNVWTRGQRIETDPLDQPLQEVSVFKLIEALGKVMAKAKVAFTHDVVVDRISIADRIQQLCDKLDRDERFTFESCFELDGLGEMQMRLEVVTTFLAVLEMARLKMIHLHQVEDGGIYVARAVADLASAAAEAAAQLAEPAGTVTPGEGSKDPSRHE
ncbi:MAG TPA: segregation/condensation protein A [Polyangia bacterium]|jgi:segregation and condensation protein A